MGWITARVAAGRDIARAGPGAVLILVSLSPIDAAIHDAYGNLHGVSIYDATRPGRSPSWDLGRCSAQGSRGRYPGGRAWMPRPAPVVPISHTVGAVRSADRERRWRTTTITGAGGVDPARWRALVQGEAQGQVNSIGTPRTVVDVYRVARLVDTGPEMSRSSPISTSKRRRSTTSSPCSTAWRSEDSAARAALDALEQPLSRNLSPGAPSMAASLRADSGRPRRGADSWRRWIRRLPWAGAVWQSRPARRRA